MVELRPKVVELMFSPRIVSKLAEESVVRK